MSGEELLAAMSDLGKGMASVNGRVSAVNYACPAREWLEGDFSDALRVDLGRLGADHYALGRDDCRSFALYAMALMWLCHNLATSATSAVAAGWLDYMHDVPDGLPVGHRINVVMLDEHSRVFYEPQLAQIVNLSQAEKDSVSGYQF